MRAWLLAMHFGGPVKGMATLGLWLPLVVAIVALQLGAGLSIGFGVR
jgi:putative oxidoreductase